ncbi:MAG: beta-ketoacyl-ACP synthase III [Candidatus Sericytochromatia bacterium]|nr:beta-ketoacyl-ACP synthase III [Candidatus Sericytochromatia bacterium]
MGTNPISLVPVAMTGVGAHVPPGVLTNDDLARLVETSDDWIVSRTGISERRVVAPGDTLWELCVPAARRALSVAGIAPEDLDLIVVATSSPDHPMPSTAALLQAALGAHRAAAFDLEAACTGFVYGLAVGSQFIRTGMYRRVLLVGADVLSRFMDYGDRGSCILFGDGAGAVVLEASDVEGLHGLVLAADGRGAGLLRVAPRTDAPPADAGVASPQFLTMNGREIYRFVSEQAPPQILAACAQAGLAPTELDHLVMHQANRRILEAVAGRLGLPMSRVPSTLARHGNTSAASIPIVLADTWTRGHLKPGDRLALTGFGAGLTWATAVVTWQGPPRRG